MTRSNSAGSIRRKLLRTTPLAGGLLAGMCLMAAPARAQQLPTGGNVVTRSGSDTVTITTVNGQANANTMTVALGNNQSTVIEWNDFNIGDNDTVAFTYCNASCATGAVVNRVVGLDDSDILGTLTAPNNLHVYLINPNGILFGSGANVNVGGLIASGLDLSLASLSDLDLTNDYSDLSLSNLRFVGSGNVTVEGQTTGNNAVAAAVITTTGGPLILLGGVVDTAGTLTANGRFVDAAETIWSGGDVVLAAGSDITVGYAAGSPMSLTITAGSPLVAHTVRVRAPGDDSGGTVSGSSVYMAVADVTNALLRVDGVVTATTATVNDRGIVLAAGTSASGIAVTATPDADPPVIVPATVSLTGTLNATAGPGAPAGVSNVELRARGAIAGTGTIDASDSVTIDSKTATVLLSANGAIDAGDDVTITGAGNVTLAGNDAIDAGGAVSVSSSGGNVSLTGTDSIGAGSGIALSAAGSTSVRSAVTSTGNLSLTGGSVLLNASTLTASAGNVSVTGPTTLSGTSTVTAGVPATAGAQTVTFNNAVTGAGTLNVHASGGTTFAAAVGGGTALQALNVLTGSTTLQGSGIRTTNGISLGALTIGSIGAVTLDAGSGVLSATGTINGAAGGTQLTLDGGSIEVANVGTGVALSSITFSAATTLSGNVAATGAVTFDEKLTLKGDGSTTGYGVIRQITAGSAVFDGDIISFKVGQNADLVGLAVDTGTGDVDFNGKVGTKQNPLSALGVRANTFDLTAINAAVGTVAINVQSGNITFTNDTDLTIGVIGTVQGLSTATGHINVTVSDPDSNPNLTIDGQVSAGGNVTLTADGSLTGSALNNISGTNIALSAVGGGVGSTTSDLNLAATGNIMITGVARGIDVALRAGGTVTTGNITAQDDIVIRSAGLATVGSLSSGNGADVAASGDTLAGPPVLTGGDIDVSGNGILVGSVTATGAQSDVTLNGGVTGIGNSTTDINVLAGRNISIIGAITARDGTFNAGDTLSFNTDGIFNQDLTLIADDFQGTSAFDHSVTRDFSVTDTLGGLTIVAAVNANGNLTLRAENGSLTINAGADVSSSTGDVTLQAVGGNLDINSVVTANAVDGGIIATATGGSVLIDANLSATGANGTISATSTGGNVEIGAVSLQAADAITLSTLPSPGGGNILLNGSTLQTSSPTGVVTLSSGGNINQTGGSIVTDTLAGSAIGDAIVKSTSNNIANLTLTAGGTLGLFSATGFTINTALTGGGFDLETTQQITVNENITATGAGSGGVTLTAGQNIALNADIEAVGQLVTLVAGTTISQSDGAITAASLGGSSGGSTTLGSDNNVATLNGFTANGFTFNDLGGLIIAGAVSGGAGGVDIDTSGALDVNAGVSATTGALSLASTGAMTVAAGVSTTTGAISLDSGGTMAVNAGVSSTSGTIGLASGDAMTISAAVGSGAAVTLAADGDISLMAGGISGTGIAISANGGNSDISLGAAVNAGSGTVSLIAGGGISQTASGVITAGTLTGSAGGSASLATAVNQIGILAGFSADGFTLRDAGGLTISGAVDGDSGGVDIESSGDIFVNGTLTGGPIAVDATGAGSDIQLSAAATGSSVALTAGGDIGVGASVSGGSVDLTAAGNIAVNAGVSGGPVDMAAGGSIGLGADVSASFLSLGAGGNITQTGGVISAGTLGGSAGGSANLAASINQIGTLAGFSANGFALLDAGGLTISGAVNGGAGGVDIESSGDILINAALTGGPVAVDATGAGSDIQLTAAVTGSSVALTAGGDLGVDGNVSGGSSVALMAGGDLGVGALVSGGSVSLGAGGNIGLGANVDGGTVSLGAGGAIQQTAGIITAGTLSGSAGGAANLTASVNQIGTLAGFTANGFALLDAGGLTISGAVTGGDGGVDIESSGDILVNAALTGDEIALDATGTGSDIQLSAAATGSSVALAAGGNIGLGANVNGGTVALTAGGSIAQTAGIITASSLTGSSVSGAVLGSAGNQITQLAGFTNSGGGGFLLVNGIALDISGDVDAGTGTLQIQGPQISFENRTLSADTDVTLAATGSLSGGTVLAGGSISGTGASVDIGTATAAAGALALTAQSGSLTLGTGSAGTTATLIKQGAGGELEVTDSLRSGTAAADGHATITSSTNARLGTVESSSGSVSVQANGSVTGIVLEAPVADGRADPQFDRANLTATGDVSVTAGGIAQLGTASAGQNLNVTAGPVADIETATAGQNVSVTAGSVLVGTANATAGSLALSAMTGQLTLNVGTAGTTATLTKLGSDGGIEVTEELSADGDVSVSSSTDADLNIVDAGGNATLAAAGALTGGTVIAGGNVTGTAGSIDFGTATAMTGALALTAQSGALVLGSGTAGTTATLDKLGSDGAIELTGTLTAAGNVSISSSTDAQLNIVDSDGSATLAAAGLLAAEEITASTNLTATAGSIDIGTAEATSGALALTASAGDLKLGDGNAGSTVTLLKQGATGNLLVTGSVTGQGNVTVTTSTNAALDRLQSNGGNIVVKAATGSVTGEGGVDNATGADLIAGPGSTTVTVEAQNWARLDQVSANLVNVGAGQLHLSNTMNGRERVDLINTGDTVTRLGSAAESGGFSLDQAEVNHIVTPTFNLYSGNAAAGFNDIAIGALAFSDATGTARINLLTTGRIDVSGAVSSANNRTVQIGGSVADPADANDTASHIWLVTNETSSGRLLMANSILNLRGARIAVGQQGLLDELGGFTDDQVFDEIGKANSKIYRGNPPWAPEEGLPPVLVSAASMTITYGNYAVFQNTGFSNSIPAGVLIGTQLAPGTLTLNSTGSGEPNGFSMSGEINGRRGVETAVLGPTFIITNGVNLNNSRLNGCLVGSGGNCIINIVATPMFNPFDEAMADVLSTGGELTLSLDPIVGANNEALFSGIASVGDANEEQECDPENTDDTCPVEEGAQ